MRPGTFLDVGCGEPFFCSNTASLEEMGWRGLLVDSNRQAIMECQKYRKSPAITEDALMIDWEVVCREHKLGPMIDYLSLDIDDEEGQPSKIVTVLKNILASGLHFRAMTIEHDRYRLGDSARDAIREILLSDYNLISADVENFEDWWLAKEIR